MLSLSLESVDDLGSLEVESWESVCPEKSSVASDVVSPSSGEDSAWSSVSVELLDFSFFPVPADVLLD